VALILLNQEDNHWQTTKRGKSGFSFTNHSVSTEIGRKDCFQSNPSVLATYASQLATKTWSL